MGRTESLGIRTLIVALLVCLIAVSGCKPASGTGGTGRPAGRTGDAAATTSARTTASPEKTPGTGRAGKDVKHADFLTGISCPAATWCVAVGWYYYGANGTPRPLAERWNGTAWQVLGLPPGGQAGRLTAVSCASQNDCTAVGSPVLGWDGSHWRVQRQHSPFDAVSCPAPSRCVAVGATSSGAPVAGTWNGSAWHLTPLPAPPHGAHSAALSAISCASARACVAVGDYTTGASARPSPGYRDRILVERWDGTTWRIAPALDVARRDKLTAISCTSQRQCTAVGSAGGKRTLAERWNGTTWHAERTPNLHAVGYSELTGVSCTSATRCMAVGDYNLSMPFAERYRQATWTITHVPTPAGQQAISGLTLSCAVNTCVLAGSDGGQTLSELWDGSSWRLEVTPSPR